MNVIEVEPYWNVNRDNVEYLYFDGTIEVEPYWNVNYHLLVQYNQLLD